ncbi:YbaK/EbsC family protein [Photobacterium lutimaris]|uniref:DNA-binding protein n=1 Tax=Photobacterium lutimaris TaxID=388278 RepID=A0A2T3IW02_9GAMM|nr:YbaK/EbsC family protein [Photobacterium lutimaris]PSU32642.1 DNA-binding protein [Photobacterium lutimaris]TDR74247.1 Ala-tRNA(Pro) deacylase [Photobacterium lutimaris]
MQPEKLEQIYLSNLALFGQTKVSYQQWQHEPILDFETDAKIANELGWTAAPTKSLFMRLKGGGHSLLLTHRDSRLDSKRVKQVLGKKVSVCSHEEMVEVIGCVPGAVCPFGLPEAISLLVDPVLYQHDELMFTPGKPELTFAFASRDLDKLLAALPNTVIPLPAE